MWDWIRKIFIGTEKDYINYRIPQLTGSKFDISQSMNISTVYTCINILSSTISRLPKEVYKYDSINGKVKDKTNPLYNILHYNVNGWMSSNSFYSYIETVRNYKGNAFAKINRAGKVTSLEIIPNSYVKGYGIEGGQLYYFIKASEASEMQVLNSNDILHYKSLVTLDGIWGVNPIESLRANLSATYKGLRAIDAFYDNNANSPKALKSTVSGANQAIMLEALEKFKTEYAGADNAGKMIPLPPNTEIQELKLNFADAEFINTTRFNVEQIAAVYGVPLDRAGVVNASKFNSVEYAGLSFKINTIASICRMYRQEEELKLLTDADKMNGISIESNTNAMIELDHKAKTEGYKVLSQMGAISPNQVAQFENLPTDKSGDVRIVPMNMMNLDKIKTSDNENE